MITISNTEINVNFNRWDAELYKVFLQSKKLPEYNLKYDWKTDSYNLKTHSRFAHIFGLKDPGQDKGWIPLADHLFDYQKYITQMALDYKRYACWADTGLGKTMIGLEFCRQVQHRTAGKVLMIVPLNIIPQTIDESRKFYGDLISIIKLTKKSDMLKWLTDGVPGMAIVNPNKFIPRKGEKETISEMQNCSGVWLDEASLLKSGGGTIKWALIKSCRGIEYKLSTTATPAPNDTMEYASQGNFLEKLRNEGEIIWTFFIRDKFGNWKVKEHAKDAFYRFMSGWSVYLRDPKNYGFADNLKDLPEPVIKEYLINVTKKQQSLIQAMPDTAGQLQIFGNVDNGKLSMVDRSKYSQMAKGFVYEGVRRSVRRIESRKPAFVADLVKKEVAAGRQVLVWTVFDAESDILADLLKPLIDSFEVLTGKIPKPKRPDIIERFRTGKTDVLISKASLLGFGLNFQNCGAMIFSGFNDSFEQLYQAIRRAYRYGQTKTVYVHIPYIQQLEGVVWNNVKRKQEQFNYDCAIQERNYLKALKGDVDATRN